MFDLFERTGDYKINYIEFAVCVQTSSPKYKLLYTIYCFKNKN